MDGKPRSFAWDCLGHPIDNVYVIKLSRVFTNPTNEAFIILCATNPDSVCVELESRSVCLKPISCKSFCWQVSVNMSDSKEFSTYPNQFKLELFTDSKRDKDMLKNAFKFYSELIQLTLCYQKKSSKICRISDFSSIDIPWWPWINTKMYISLLT